MGTFFYNNVVSQIGTIVVVGTGNQVFVTTNGFVESTSANTIEMTGSGHLRVEGSLWANSDFYAVHGNTDFGMSMTISETGQVFSNTSSTGTAVFFEGRASVTNAGSISNANGNALVFHGDSTMMNSGEVRGGAAAVAFNPGTTGGALFNSGLISGGNSPTPGAFVPHGVYMASDNAAITNTGTISSQYLGGHGIHVVSSDVFIENHGFITALRGVGIDAGDTSDGIDVLNTGTITGDSFAIRGGFSGDLITNLGTITVVGRFGTALLLGDGVDTVINRGVINGAVNLGFDPDTYLGTHSTAGADVNGGDGADNVVGGAFDDTLRGGNDTDFLSGGAGNDGLFDTDGNTTIFGGAGDDTASVTTGASEISGGAGDDDLTGGAGADTLIGNAGDDTLAGGLGSDIYGVNSLADVVTEASGTAAGTADVVTSGAISLDLNLYAFVERATLTGAGALRLTGNAGANVLTGNVAGNVILGGAGIDTILGGDGADVMTGGTGRDSLTGGAGADVFVLLSAAETGLAATTQDVITDFAVGVDDLRMIFMSSFIGAAGFTAAGQVRYNAVTGVLAGNTDADAFSEWTVQLSTGLALTAGDFVF